MYLQRNIDKDLLQWKTEKDRKPLLIRGARQVGKSSSVRELGKQFENYLEINFEANKSVNVLFEGDLNPEAICENLSIMFDKDITPGKTLIFFDEIQNCIPAISSLRFFYEKLPEQHIIAAGSLLEFALEQIPSFGVGRIRSLYLYPLSFDEFLIALGHEKLFISKQKADTKHPLALPIHKKLNDLLKRFLIIGGMPEVVSKYSSEKNMSECQKILDDLIQSYKTDFAKYKRKIPHSNLNEVFESVVQQAGNKFVYAKASQTMKNAQIKLALDLLIMAGLVIPVTHSSANGIPLGAEKNSKKRKMLFLDTGLFQRILGLDISTLLFSEDFKEINRGNIAEQFAGLEMLKYASVFTSKELFYWHREALNSNAEVDYLIQQHDKIIPIEVKSGTKGSMKSIHIFLEEKNSTFAYRTSLENFASFNNIEVIPLYALSSISNRRENS